MLWDLQVATGHNPFPAPSDAFYLLSGVCCSIGLVLDMRRLADGGRIRTVALDAGNFAVAALTVVLALYLPLRGTYTLLQMAVLVAYPIGMLTAACLAFTLVPALRLRVDFGWALVAGALAANGWLWMRWNALTLSGGLADGTFYNACFSIAAIALGVGIARWVPRATTRHALARRYDALMRLLPLAAVVGACMAMLVAFTLPDVPTIVQQTCGWGAAVVLTLAFARQSLLVHERERMLEMERQFRTLFDSAPEAILLMDAAKIVDCNASAERMFGIPACRMIGMVPSQLSPEHQEDGRTSLDAATERIRAALDGEPQNFRWRHVRDGDGPFEAEVALHRVELPGRTLMQAVVRDVTEQLENQAQQERLEDQLRQAARMEAVGRLAGGVAHDFNNILTVILGTSELALMKLPASHGLRRELGEIRKSAQRAAALTAQLLAFSRKQVSTPVPCDLNALVNGALGMLHRLIGEDVRIEFEASPCLGTVLVDRTQFEQVLMNLAVNGRDAMPHGGRLLVRTGTGEFRESDLLDHPNARPGRFARLEVSDQGKGIAPELLPHVFEPFFTTKEFGSGTGLGLSTVYGIVRQANGFIEVQSTVNEGTCFTAWFPLVDGAAAHTPAAEPAPQRGSAEHILLVEDEPVVRELARRMLGDLGYRVTEAPDGAEALKLMARPGAHVDLVLTDVIMPGMSGKQLHDRLAREHPGLPTLFMSGYTANVLDTHGVGTDGPALLQKPFTLAELSAAVRRAIERAKVGGVRRRT
ncbi:MAG: response regulator [Candidatus Eisenbacteria bacterium]|uniref:histidine kinase n=1 Tax=Eiseniibacteriota bacterium TaxID=2212470 RepID=A0A933SAG5_UNCEI|nr:response regulator [Candidatus Eisenbacteria bacterium]